MVKQNQYSTNKLFSGEGNTCFWKQYCAVVVLIDLSVYGRSVYLGLTEAKHLELFHLGLKLRLYSDKKLLSSGTFHICTSFPLHFWLMVILCLAVH